MEGEAEAAPSAAAKASATALSLAAAARSKLSQGGRRIISPLAHVAAGGSGRGLRAGSSMEDEAAGLSAASLTAGLSSSLASASSSLVTASSSISSMLFSAPGSAASTPGSAGGSGASAAELSEIAAAEEEFRQVSAQQRMRILEELVQNRRSDWNYLKLMHEGSNYWLNVALLREQQVMAHLGQKQTIRRGVQFFYLGLGLGRIINESTHPETLAMDCCQLLEELEFYFSSATVQGMKMMVATSSTFHEPIEVQDDALRYSVDEPFRPSLYKWNQRPVFRRLMTPPIPFPLDYREVLLSLCDILAIIYSKLVEDNSSSENVNIFQAIIRFDDRIKKLFIDPVKKEFSTVALQVITEEITSVRKAYASRTSVSLPPATIDATSASPMASES